LLLRQGEFAFAKRKQPGLGWKPESRQYRTEGGRPAKYQKDFAIAKSNRGISPVQNWN